MTTRQAFGILLTAAAAELDKVQKEGSACSLRGETAQAQAAVARLERIQALRAAAQNLQEEWHQVMPMGFPLPPRTASGRKTPETMFWLPILLTISELGGEGRVHVILDRVGEMMAPIFSDLDGQPLSGHETVRWRNKARWARQHMVDQGYLRSDFPRGVWVISDQGREYLANQLPLFPDP